MFITERGQALNGFVWTLAAILVCVVLIVWLFDRF